MRQIEAVNAQTGPVMMGYPAAPEDRRHAGGAPNVHADVDVIADDGVRHQLWVVDDDETIDALTRPLTRCRRYTSATGITVRRPLRGSLKPVAAAAAPWLFSRSAFSASRDDHPGLQSRGARI